MCSFQPHCLQTLRRRRPAGKDQMTRLIFESMIAKKPDIGMLRFYRHDFLVAGVTQRVFYRLIISRKSFLFTVLLKNLTGYSKVQIF